MYHTGEQWDWPNVWAPMQHMMIVGLDNLDDERTKKLAYSWAERWVQTNYYAFRDTGAMFEKVDNFRFLLKIE
jgi:alpha,alpha-trehalase